MKFLDAAGSRMVTPSWVAKAKIAQLTKKEDNNERKEEKK
jgi:hypothetical protein